MPRIGAALAVVATLVASIAVNTYRYPVVREMMAAVPPFQLALRAREAPQPDRPATPASDSTNRQEPAPAPSVAARAAPRPFDLVDPPGLPPLPRLPAKVPSLASGLATPGTGEDPAPAQAAEVERPLDPDQRVAGANGQAPPALAPLEAIPGQEAATVASVPRASSHPATPAEAARPRIVQVRARPPEVGLEPDPTDRIERLPPVDQVWPAERAGAPLRGGGRLPIYPTTGIE